MVWAAEAKDLSVAAVTTVAVTEKGGVCDSAPVCAAVRDERVAPQAGTAAAHCLPKLARSSTGSTVWVGRVAERAEAQTVA